MVMYHKKKSSEENFRQFLMGDEVSGKVFPLPV